MASFDGSAGRVAFPALASTTVRDLLASGVVCLGR
jgi:hypothetical protein